MERKRPTKSIFCYLGFHPPILTLVTGERVQDFQILLLTTPLSISVPIIKVSAF